ncbi:MAG: hypothetical protein ACI8V2_001521 [Candidatus Latescibacterota bacterium]|jgi:hypothetical protein
MATIEDRLERLERSQTRYRFITIGLLLVLIASLSMGQANNLDDIVCRSLTVLQDGKVVIANGTVSTYSPSGEALIVLNSTENGGVLTTYSKLGKALVKLGPNEFGNGSVASYSSSGNGLVKLSSNNYGDGSLVTFLGSGKKAVAISSVENKAAIAVYNKNGKAKVFN